MQSGGRRPFFAERLFNSAKTRIECDMPDVAARRDPQIVSRAMRRVKSRDTTPEIALRKQLWRLGLRFRLHSRLPGKPDIVFPGKRVAVFVDGDFWHGRQWKTRGFDSLADQMNRVNRSQYWLQKLQRTIDRDKCTTAALEAAGWKVVRMWESEIRRNPDEAAARVAATVYGATR